MALLPLPASTWTEKPKRRERLAQCTSTWHYYKGFAGHPWELFNGPPLIVCAHHGNLQRPTLFLSQSWGSVEPALATRGRAISKRRSCPSPAADTLAMVKQMVPPRREQKVSYDLPPFAYGLYVSSIWCASPYLCSNRTESKDTLTQKRDIQTNLDDGTF